MDGRALLAVQFAAADRRHAQRRRRLEHRRPRIGDKPPVSARWGDCKMDWPRANIVSPYPFKTAKEHYDALLADTKTRGGPTTHTYETMPKWDGVYGEFVPQGRRVWNYSRANQVPTLLSLLTPDYQQRMVRQLYHEGVNAAHQWSASYCWPEGFMRQWATGAKPSRVVVTPEIVMFMGSGSGNMWRIVNLNRDFPLGSSVPQWYGDTVGFWDGDTLIMLDRQYPGVEPAFELGVERPAGVDRDLHARPRRQRQVPRPRLGDGALRFRGAGAAGANPVAPELSAEMEHRRPAWAGGVHPAALPGRRLRDAGRAGAGHRVQGPGHARPAVGQDWEDNFEKDMERPKEELDLGFK